MQALYKQVWQMLDLSQPVGIGTGRTVEAWLKYGYEHGYKLEQALPSSKRSAELLKSYGVLLLDLQTCPKVDFYIDSADEVDVNGYCIKGGGGAMTFEKIIRSVAREFVCMVHEKKLKSCLGDFPLAIEVLPAARSYVGRQLLTIGADPVYREGWVTDSGNIIIDAYGLDFTDPAALEQKLDSMLAVVGHGLFVKNSATVIFTLDEKTGQIKKNEKKQNSL